MSTVKKCVALGLATLAFASMLVFGSDPALRAQLFGREPPAPSEVSPDAP